MHSATFYEDDLTVWEFWKVCVAISTTVRGSEAKGLCNVHEGKMIILATKIKIKIYPSLGHIVIEAEHFLLTPDT